MLALVMSAGSAASQQVNVPCIYSLLVSNGHFDWMWAMHLRSYAQDSHLHTNMLRTVQLSLPMHGLHLGGLH